MNRHLESCRVGPKPSHLLVSVVPVERRLARCCLLESRNFFVCLGRKILIFGGSCAPVHTRHQSVLSE